MIQLPCGKKIRLPCAGNPTAIIYFDKFEDFNKIMELWGRSSGGHP
jgi:hypothetical protein